ncbi:helix-turn-helix transcriptional regulator [Bacillus gobiensis]|uniref:helix-turn-helix transcriptional regulator n=1 Tax=Bacillus gobiensis TaxID=1441095 RepID=UPI003D2548D6
MNRQQIEKILKDYSWMINSIKILRDSMKDAGEGLTAQYGIESVQPKPQGTTSDPVYREVVRREKRFKKVAHYEEKVKVIQDRLPAIKEEREIEVLHWLLEGKSYRWIGAHMGLSFSHIKRIRDSIVDQLADVTNGTNGTNETKLHSHNRAG